MVYDSRIQLLAGMDEVMRPLAHAFCGGFVPQRRQAQNAAASGLLRSRIVRARQLMGLHGPHPGSPATIPVVRADRPFSKGPDKVSASVVVTGWFRVNCCHMVRWGLNILGGARNLRIPPLQNLCSNES